MTHYHLVTGKLAADAVHTVARRMMADDPELACTVEVLPITVAALMTVEWIGRNLANVPDSAEIVLLPGYCRGDVQCLEQTWGRPVRLGPKEVRMLPVYLGQQSAATDAYGDYDIEIVAEINHAPDRPIEDIVQIAEAFRADGADIIDLGCNPGSHWHDIGTCVRALRDRQLRVSVDSFEPAEIAA
ncbi:MAG: dihydropteroate synthase, partial [Planctomycetales bacterium]|nr:dihydropteroate synthase [Planctomycetales bacterium]